MSVTAFLAALQRHLAVAPWGPWARGAWCRKQRRQLRDPNRSVVWVRGDKVSWAEWGGRHGFFDVQYMDGLAYLRALGAPAA
jgi:hypothetical protein